MSLPILAPPPSGPQSVFVTQQGLARYPVGKYQFLKNGPEPDGWYQSAVSDRWFPLWREDTVQAFASKQDAERAAADRKLTDPRRTVRRVV